MNKMINKLLPEEILEKAYEFYEKGEYKTSLEYYEWFFDSAEDINPNYDGAKYRSLNEWYCLGKKYPPAFDALNKRKEKLYKLFQKEKSIKTFRDYIKVCNALKHNQDAIDLFLYFHIRGNHFAKEAYSTIESILIENKEWELCNYYIDDSMKKYENILVY
ncbi:MAG: hypothetical protein L3J43_05865 [Sulfurovum sp.]|nr:hypothetical protein [Sulfurovum sp.]